MPDSRQSRRRRNRMQLAADRAMVLDEANLRAAINDDSSDDDDEALHPATQREREIYQMGFRDGEERAWSKAREVMEKLEDEKGDASLGGLVIGLVLCTAVSVLIVHREALWEALQSY